MIQQVRSNQVSDVDVYLSVWPVLRRLQNPDAVLVAIERYAEALVDVDIAFLLAENLGQTRLSRQGRMAVLRVLTRGTDYFGARRKDWPDGALQRVGFDTIWQAVDAEVRADPTAAVPLLAAWLSDGSRMQEEEATVGDFAFALLSLWARAVPEAVFDALVIVNAPGDHLFELARRGGAASALEQCRRWLDTDREDLLPAVVWCAHGGLAVEQEPRLREPLLEIAHAIRGMPVTTESGRDARHLAGLCLADQPETALEVLDETLADLRAGRHTSAWPFAMAIQLDPDRAVRELLQLTAGCPALADETARHLDTRPVRHDTESRFLAALADAEARGAISRMRRAHIVVDRLEAVGDGPAYPGLVELMRELAADPDPDVRRYIGFFRDRAPKGAEAQRLRAELVELLRPLPDRPPPWD